ncbi:MAG: hypothetical protein JXA49_01955 [Actinobacteria bacterium]|nr:hypothetical protein [Actinomycetota bacterium]
MGPRRTGLHLFVIIFLISIMAVSLCSCGAGGNGDEKAVKEGDAGLKLPPGTSEEELEEATFSGGADDSVATKEEQPAQADEEKAQVQTPGTSGDLAGGRFTIMEAVRKESNSDVIKTGAREVKGDYLEIELEIQNAGDDLINLADYSFRLQSPGIEADNYQDYYGQAGTYGKYVSEDTIGGTLLDYGTLEPVDYKVKMGEVVDKVFLFLDLNPKSVARNDLVTKENTVLVIKKTQGSDYGEKIEMGLAGYPD